MKWEDKVKELENLAEITAKLHVDGKRVVHCHGVFDLLHVGHIRHFRAARELGDILVVTLTPDQFVDKGPHRPIFPEKLRVEAVATLECVDYVAVNRWPKAVETIKLLKPDVYVKGADYKDERLDLTGGIVLEKEAVESVGGRLAFTDDLQFSSTSLINRHLSPFSKEVAEYLSLFSSRHSVDEILSYINGAKRLKVLTVGEAIIDEYQYCQAIGKSSKEPTLVVRSESKERFAGGILAIANHVSGFSDSVGIVTCLGEVSPQAEFVTRNLQEGIDRFFFTKSDSPTITKRRFVENYFFTKLLEVYEINDQDLNAADNMTFCSILSEKLPHYDVVIVVDYGHGLLSQEAIDILSKQAKFLCLNVQANAGNRGYHTVSAYQRADYISMAEAELRLEARSRRGDLKRMVEDVSRKLDCPKVVVTRGSNGSLCYGREEGFLETPALATRVVDRVGAGDASLSLSSLCAAQRAPMDIISFVGNAAGAQAVSTVCNREAISRVSLVRQVESLLK